MKVKDLRKIYESNDKNIEAVLSTFDEKIEEYSSILGNIIEDIVNDTYFVTNIIRNRTLTEDEDQLLANIQDTYHNSLMWEIDEEASEIIRLEDRLYLDADDDDDDL